MLVPVLASSAESAITLCMPVAVFAEEAWLFNIFLFVVFTALYATRWVDYSLTDRQIFSFHSRCNDVLRHYSRSGLATIINGFGCLACHVEAMAWVRIAEMLGGWIAGELICRRAALTFLQRCLPREHSIDQMTAVWLLPVEWQQEVATASGVVSSGAAADRFTLVVLVTSYAMEFPLPVAFGVLTIILLRMALINAPRNAAASSWLASRDQWCRGAVGVFFAGGGRADHLRRPSGLPGVGEIARWHGADGRDPLLDLVYGGC